MTDFCVKTKCTNVVYKEGRCRYHYYKGENENKSCKVRGCESPYHASGYCTSHYRQVRKHGKIVKVKLRNSRPDLIGEKFGRLLVTGRIKSSEGNDRNVRWKCKCDCGVIKVLATRSLTSRDTRSCGCLKKDVMNARCKFGKPGRSRLWGQYRRDAAKRNIAFLVTPEKFFELVESDCYYCGVSLSNEIKIYSMLRRGGSLVREQISSYVYNGIDRVDPTRGYVEGNLVPCCRQCNVAKWNMPQQEFYDWIERIVKHRKHKTANKTAKLLPFGGGKPY